MFPLHQCQCCGHLSTLGGNFTWMQGVLLDLNCKAAVDRGQQPQTGWFKAAVAATATSAN